MTNAVITYEQQLERDMRSALAAKGWHYMPGRSMTRPPLPRAYKAGEQDRLTESFRITTYTADEHLRSTLKNMRARSRYLCMNDPYAKHFVDLLDTNIVGPDGITLQNQAKTPDLKGRKDRAGRPLMVFDVWANDAIEGGWVRWGVEGVCDVTGEHSIREIQSLVVKTTARDGEVLVRKLYGRKWNEYGFAVDIIEADFLDENNWQLLPNGNRVIMGVEKDPWGRKVAFHFLSSHPGATAPGYAPLAGDTGYFLNGRYYVRISAEEIIHIGVSDRPRQTRYVPWMFASMIRLNQESGFEEAAVINARIGATKMGFIKTDQGLDAMSTSVSSTGELQFSAEPGEFHKLPQDWELQEFNPQYPNNEFKAFSTAMLHGIAAGFGVSYSSLTGDLAEVNFSSIRSGKVDERDVYKQLQAFFARKLLGPAPSKLFPSWLDSALMLGAIKMQNGSALPWAKFDKFNAPKWQGRGFDWVDPKDDIEADTVAVNNGFLTRTEVCAKRGKDFRDVCAELAEEKRIAEEYGLDFSQGKTEAAFKAAAGGKKQAEDDKKRQEKKSEFGNGGDDGDE